MIRFEHEEVVLKGASPEQAKLAAPLIYDTDPALFNYLFRDDYEIALRYFSEEWTQKKSLYSFSHCTAATRGDTLLGIELGYDRKTQEEVLRETGRRGAGSLTPEMMKRLREAVGYLPYLTPPIPGDAYYILFLSVIPGLRDRGIGERLLTNAFHCAGEKGYRMCQLDVASDNRAVDFYRRMGMEVVSECRVLPMEKHGVSTHYRMVKDLGGSARQGLHGDPP